MKELTDLTVLEHNIAMIKNDCRTILERVGNIERYLKLKSYFESREENCEES
jgi:hypothetical protein